MNRCHTCGKRVVTHKQRDGLKLFCNSKCFGLSRRKGKTKAQRIEEKRLYDAAYRAKNRALLKAKKADYFQRTYDPVEAAKERKKRMPLHVEYCRQPEYRKYKQQYDKQYRAKADFGPFWEAAILLNEIDKEIGSRATYQEIAAAKGTTNKSIQRRREYEKHLNGG